jgi:hypothetical protein
MAKLSPYFAPRPSLNWHMPVGFALGIVLILISAAFTVSALTGLPLSTPVVCAIFLILIVLYFFHAFTVTVCIYLIALSVVATWPTSEFLTFQGRLAAALLDAVPQPEGGEVLAGELAIVLCCGFVFEGKRIESRASLFFYFLLVSTSLSAVLSILIQNGVNSQTVPVATTFGLISAFFGFLFYLEPKQTGRTFFTIWSEIGLFDTQFARYVATRAQIIFLVTMAYLYVVVSFAAIYYHVDNCDHANRLCSFVVYKGFLSEQPDKELCWSFRRIPPVAYGNKTGADPGLCEDHKATQPFSVERFLPYLYFSMVTSTTVGYGDLAPLSVTAVWIVIIHHLVSIILLVAVVAQLANFSIPSSGPPAVPQ